MNTQYSNHDRHDHDHTMLSSRAPELQAGIICSVILAIIIVLLRLYTRLFIVKSLGPDDYLISAAMIIVLVLMAIALEGTNAGWGHYFEELPKEWYDRARHYAYLAQIIFVPITTLTKFSILYSYLRISPNRTFQHRVYFLFVWTSMWCVASLVALVFRCSPVRAYWIDGIKNATCINSQALILASGAINSITDLAVAILPAPMLWKANLPKRDRGGLVVMFAMTGIVCVVGVARCGIYYDTTERKGLLDCTWGGGVAVVLGIVETCTGIIGASIPVLRPLWSRYFGERRQSELINDGSSPDLGKGGNAGMAAVQQDIEASAGGFSYATTRPSTPTDVISTNPKGSISPIQNVTFNPFRSVNEMNYGKRLSRRLSAKANSLAGDENEASRVPTGRTWLSLDGDDGEISSEGAPARPNDVTATPSRTDSNEMGNSELEDNHGSENQDTPNRMSACRSPTPPLPPGVEISDNEAFSFAPTATTTPVLTAKSSKASLKVGLNDCDDRNAQSSTDIITPISDLSQSKKRDSKSWIPDFTLPFRVRSRGRTLDSADTYELGRSKSQKKYEREA